MQFSDEEADRSRTIGFNLHCEFPSLQEKRKGIYISHEDPEISISRLRKPEQQVQNFLLWVNEKTSRKKEDLQSREGRKIKTKDETRTRKHAGRSQIIVRCNSQMEQKKKQIEDPEAGIGFQLPAEGDERCAATYRSVCDPCRFVVIWGARGSRLRRSAWDEEE